MFLLLTLLATLGLGEHYLIDLVVAVPFTVAIRACFFDSSWSRQTIWVVISNAALLTSWLFMLRCGILVNIPISLAWSLALVTVTFGLMTNPKSRQVPSAITDHRLASIAGSPAAQGLLLLPAFSAYSYLLPEATQDSLVQSLLGAHVQRIEPSARTLLRN